MQEIISELLETLGVQLKTIGSVLEYPREFFSRVDDEDSQ